VSPVAVTGGGSQAGGLPRHLVRSDHHRGEVVGCPFQVACLCVQERDDQDEFRHPEDLAWAGAGLGSRSVCGCVESAAGSRWRACFAARSPGPAAERGRDQAGNLFIHLPEQKILTAIDSFTVKNELTRVLEHPGFHAHLVLCDAASPGSSARCHSGVTLFGRCNAGCADATFVLKHKRDAIAETGVR
jgi:hypothetical protein